VVRKIISPRVTASKEEIIAFYDQFASVYAAVSFWEKEAQEIAITKAGIEEGYKVLDVGCGPGTVITKVAEIVGFSGKVYGLDLSEKMLEEAKKKAQSIGVQDRIKLRKADIHEELPFEDDFFDVVISTYVFDLVDTPHISKVLSNMIRVLKLGGKLVLVNWTLGEGPHKKHSDVFIELFKEIKVDFGCRPVYLLPYMKEFNLKNLGREYISYEMPPQIRQAFFATFEEGLKRAPKIAKKLADLQTFVYSSEIVWGTK